MESVKMVDTAQEMSSSNADINKMKKYDKTEGLRMWSAISFALIILGLGIPLWWKTTEVYRVTLPYSEIDELQSIEPLAAVNISMISENPSNSNNRIVELKTLLSSKLFNINYSLGDFEGYNIKSVEELEDLEFEHPAKPGNLKIIENRKLQSGKVILGNHRSLYFHPDVKTQLIVNVLQKWVLREDYLNDQVITQEQPCSRNITGQDRRLKSEPCFDIVFTIVNPEPDQVKISFDAESSITNVIDPLLSQLKPVANLKIKSQWLYFVDIGLQPNKNPKMDGSIISYDRIAHIISPLEKKLGSGVSSCPCLHFVLYVPRCTEAPLYFSSLDGNLETAVVSPRWGGIQIHNPSVENCINKTGMSPDINQIAKVFVSHLRYLLDLHYNPIFGSEILPFRHSPLRGWEIDSLYRSQILEQAISARLTLQSLSRLLGEISNIVINEEVGNAIKTSVISISASFFNLAAGNLEDSLKFAKTAYVTSETAFSHPSLLALLYFPDDQKYAVYIPLFLPVMIPVLLSLKNIWKWINNIQITEQ